MDKKITKISISQHNREVSYMFDYFDTTVEELYTAFKGMLLALEYSEESISEYLKSLNDE